MEKQYLQNLIDQNLSVRDICLRAKKSTSTVCYYLRYYKLKTNHKPFTNISPRKSTRYTDFDIKVAVSNSFCIADVLLRLSLCPRGGNYRTIKSRIKELGIDTSHFSLKEVIQRRLKNKNFEGYYSSLEDVLVQNSKYKNTSLKKRLYENKIKKEECEICGQGAYWQGQKLVLILDHINGIHSDNRINNLRIVCPNCNSQLPTHGTKNFKTTRKTSNCLACSKQIKNGNKYCTDCRPNNILHRNRKVIDRPDISILLTEVEEKGYCWVGRKYNVSDNCIRKWIKSGTKKINLEAETSRRP